MSSTLTHLGPFLAPLVPISFGFFLRPAEALEVVGDIAVGDPSSVKLVVQLEEPAFDVEVLRDQLGQTLVELWKQPNKTTMEKQHFCLDC